MKINDLRINKLIDKFWERMAKNGMDDFYDYFSYPGGIVWITEKQYKMKKNYDEDATGYIKKTKRGTSKADDKPCFKIVFIKECVLRLDDKEFLNSLAHELGHIFFLAEQFPQKFDEYACDILAEYFFGFPKPKGSSSGYLHDNEGFKKIWGRKPPK